MVARAGKCRVSPSQAIQPPQNRQTLQSKPLCLSLKGVILGFKGTFGGRFSRVTLGSFFRLPSAHKLLPTLHLQGMSAVLRWPRGLAVLGEGCRGVPS